MSDAAALRAALGAAPALVLVETPSNPLLRITDVEAACRQAHAAGARVVVDNTFLSPVLQQPLALGADLVVYSTTKYLNGHSDVVGGAVVAGDEALGAEIAWWANCLGVTGAPFDSYLTLRGLRTLDLRMREHERNAGAVVELLARHPRRAARALSGPGVASGTLRSPRASSSGFGAMVSFELAGDTRHVRTFLAGLECLFAGGVAGWRREPDRASGDDDARGDGSGGTPSRRDRRHAAAHLRRHRGRRGSRARSRPGAGSGRDAGSCGFGLRTPLTGPQM